MRPKELTLLNESEKLLREFDGEMVNEIYGGRKEYIVKFVKLQRLRCHGHINRMEQHM